jgi:hypothetical protein
MAPDTPAAHRPTLPPHAAPSSLSAGMGRHKNLTASAPASISARCRRVELPVSRIPPGRPPANSAWVCVTAFGPDQSRLVMRRHPPSQQRYTRQGFRQALATLPIPSAMLRLGMVTATGRRTGRRLPRRSPLPADCLIAYGSSANLYPRQHYPILYNGTRWDDGTCYQGSPLSYQRPSKLATRVPIATIPLARAPNLTGRGRAALVQEQIPRVP